MKVVIFGAGYVGLVTGACLAKIGHSVCCIDIDEQRIVELNKGNSPIYEPGLSELLQEMITLGRLHFTVNNPRAIEAADIAFIAVGTPPHEDGSADLSHVLAVAKTLGEVLEKNLLVVNKSTVPVGTAQKVHQTIKQELDRRGVSFTAEVASNPEFLKEGAAIVDFMEPSRIVIGIESSQAESLLRTLYQPLISEGYPLITMDLASAELTKYAANAMLATKISLMNEMSQLADYYHADIEQVRKAIGSDPRIGPHFIQAGCGFGGSCFPKDVKALQAMSFEASLPGHVLKAVAATNELQKQSLFAKLSEYFNHQLAGLTISIWGLAFKPNTDDIREASSLVLIKALLKAGVKVQAYDPIVGDAVAQSMQAEPLYQAFSSSYAALQGANALVLVTEWDEFRRPDFQRMKEALKQPFIVDGRNIYDPVALRAAGFDYVAFGRTHIKGVQ